MEDGASGKLNIGFVDASFDPKLSGGDGAVLEPFQERAQSNTMTRGVTINQAGGTMVAGGSTSNIGFNTPVFSSGLPGSAQYGYGSSFWYNGGSLFVTTEGKVYVGGDNIDGEAGDSTTSNVFEWTESTPASSYPILAFSSGNAHNMVLDGNGQLWAAGKNTFGQLGVGDTTRRKTWTANTSVGTVQAVSPGYDHTLILKTDGTLQACGAGGSYRMGTGSTSTQTSFVDSASGAMSGYKAKSCWGGSSSSFAIRSDNKLVGVGYNGFGEIGTGTATNPITTWTLCNTTNYGSETPVQVSCGFGGANYFTMMITAEGNIYGTGDGGYYKTGLNSTTDVNLFTRCTGDIQSVTVTRVSTTSMLRLPWTAQGTFGRVVLAHGTG
jgi:alpha-tubulin suppressor-like RCC1 family protein